MRGRQVKVLCSLAILALAAACTPDRQAAGGAPLAPAGEDGGSGGGSEGGSNAGGGGSSSEGGELGSLPVEPLGGDCVAMTATPGELYPEDAAPLYPNRLVAVGSAWVASSSIEDGFVRFDQDGANAGDLLTSGLGLHRVASHGDALLVASLAAEGDVGVERYDDSIEPTASAVIGTGPAEAIAAVASPERALVSWAANGEIRAVVVDAELEPLGGESAIAGPSYLDDVSLAATATPGAFAVAWTGATSEGYLTRFARVDPSGAAGEPVDVVRTDQALRVLDLASAGEGFVLLLGGVAPGFESYLVRLDEGGSPIAPAVQLLEVFPGWDLASAGDSVAVVASRQDGRPALRVLDATLAPLGSWICLAEKGNADLPAAVEATDSRFAAVFPAAPGEAVSPALLFAELDAAGQ